MTSRPIPPLIDTATSRLVRLRDWILTLLAWLVMATLVTDALVLGWDFLQPPRFHFTKALPSWNVVLGIVVRHQPGLELIALWLLCWGLSFSMQHRAVARRAAKTPPVTRPELAAAVGVPEATLASMEAIKLLEVDIGEDCRIAAVRPSSPPLVVA